MTFPEGASKVVDLVLHVRDPDDEAALYVNGNLFQVGGADNLHYALIYDNFYDCDIQLPLLIRSHVLHYHGADSAIDKHLKLTHRWPETLDEMLQITCVDKRHELDRLRRLARDAAEAVSQCEADLEQLEQT